MNSFLLLYAIYAKVVIAVLGYYVYKYRKQLKKLESGPIGYMCSTDFAHELSWGKPGVGVGSSVEVFDSLKGAKDKECTRQCGITKVRLVKLEVMQETNWRA